MAIGSQRYSLYYGGTTVFFTLVSIWCFAIVSDVASDCQPACPLLLESYISPEGENRSYGLCACPAPAATDSCDADCQLWTSAARVWQTGQITCYICGTGTIVMMPCPATGWSSAQTLCPNSPAGFKPVPDSLKGSLPCAGGIEASILRDGTIRAREWVALGLYAIGSFYVVQALCTAVCFVGFQSFAHKESDDWLKLTRIEKLLGIACKLAPPFVRVTNFIVLFFVMVGGLFVFSFGVCWNDRNEFGEREFFPQTYNFISVTIVIWLATFVFGSLFNAFVPRDTAFYAPRTPMDKTHDPAWYRFLSRFLFEAQRWGP